jgi:hypothetical protein
MGRDTGTSPPVLPPLAAAPWGGILYNAPMDERAGKRTKVAYWVGAALVALVAIIGIQYLAKLATDATPGVWLAMMRRQLPDKMCKSGGFFRTCFGVGEEECRAAVAAHLEAVRRHVAHRSSIQIARPPPSPLDPLFCSRSSEPENEGT